MEMPNYVLKANEGVLVPKDENSFLGSFVGGLFASSKMVPSPFEIQFFDDYLIIYREKKYYSKNVIRKEYDKFFYKDIAKCQFRTETKQINIYGIIEGIRYNYNKDGSLPEKPNYHKVTDGGISWFYTSESPHIDFVSEIEKNSPIKVIIENN